MQLFDLSVKNRAQLWWKEQGQYCFARIGGLCVDFEVAEASTLEANGAASLVHRHLNGIGGPIGWALLFTLRRAENGFHEFPAIPSSSINLPYWLGAAPFEIWGSRKAANIASIDDHYANPSINFGVRSLTPGFYRLETWGNAHSTAWPDGTNGLIEFNQNLLPDGSVDLASANFAPYSYMRVKIEPSS